MTALARELEFAEQELEAVCSTCLKRTPEPDADECTYCCLNAHDIEVEDLEEASHG